MGTVKLGPQARDDLDETVDFLCEEASSELAERFAEAAWNTFHWLANNVHAGRVIEIRSKRAKGIRGWRVDDFEDWLIMYRPVPEGIVVFRVIHGARNLPAQWQKTLWD